MQSGRSLTAHRRNLLPPCSQQKSYTLKIVWMVPPKLRTITVRLQSVSFENIVICTDIAVGTSNLTVFTFVDKAVPLQAWSGPEVSRKLIFPDFMTTVQDGGKIVSLMHLPPLPPGNTPGTNFCQRLSRPQGHSATGRILSLKNSNDTIGNRTRDLSVCSVVP